MGRMLPSQEQLQFSAEKSPERTSELVTFMTGIRRRLDSLRSDRNIKAFSADDAERYRAEIAALQSQLQDELPTEDSERTKIIQALCRMESVLVHRERYGPLAQLGYGEVVEEATLHRSMIQFIAANDGKPDVLRAFWDRYYALFGQGGSSTTEANIVRNGVLAELAAARYFSQKEQGTVYLPSVSEDVDGSVDLFVELPTDAKKKRNELLLVVQVKGHQLDQASMHDLMEHLVEIISPKDFDTVSQQRLWQSDHDYEKRQRFLNHCREFAEKLKVAVVDGPRIVRENLAAAFLVIPTQIEKQPGYWQPVLDMRRGELAQGVIDNFLAPQLQKQLERSKRRL